MIDTTEVIETIDAANLEAWEMVRIEPAKALQIAKENLIRAQDLGYEKGIAWATGNIGAACTWMSEYEDALEYCFEAVDLLKACGEFKQEVQIHYYLSIVFYLLGDPEKQLEHCQTSYDRAVEIGDEQGQANALNGLGTCYYTNGQNKEAIDALKKGLILAEKVNDINLLGRINDGLGNSYLNLEQYEEALKYMNVALSFVEKTGVKQTLSYAHDGIGEIYTKLGNYPKALEHFNKSYQYRQEMGFKDGMGINKLHMAHSYQLAGDNLSAVQSYKDALLIGEELESKELIFKSHKGLSELYEDMGNLTLFVKHFKAYHSAQQDFITEKEGKKIKAFELKGRLDQIQKEKEALEKKNDELESYFNDVQILSKIGHEITSTLDIERIFQIIYERINSLMDATGVYIGICNVEENKLQVELAINEDKRDEYFEYSLDEDRLSNVVAKSGTPIHINDYDKEVKNYLPNGEAIIHAKPVSVVILPLMVKEEILGILYAQSFNKNAFSQHHFNLLQSFASYIAIALDNAMLYEQMDAKVKSRTDELEITYKNSELLNKIGQELISTLDFEDVFEKLYHNVNQLMDATVFGVRLYEKEKGQVNYLYEYERGERHGEIIVPITNLNNYSVWCIVNNKEVFINDNTVDYKNYVEEVMVVEGDFPYSLIFYPLRDGDEVLGCISVQSFEKNAYSQYHLSIVKTLAQYTVLALKNARSYELMEEKVNERTAEITKTYENTKVLSEIGKNITSQLSIENILNIAYDSINEMMDAEGFGIGILNKEEDSLYFPTYIESGERLDAAYYSLNEENRLASICFNKDEEIIINDFENDAAKWIKNYVAPKIGRSVNSLIYLPLYSKGKKIGVITVQSFKNNSYSEYEVNMLRSIGVYSAIALDNAKLYENMEEIVKERTAEIIEQKEEIEQSYQNTRLISQINKDIAQSITIPQLIDSVYENINSIMDATGFGIGVYYEELERIRMIGYIEKGEKLPDFEYDVKDERLAPWCFNNQQEIYIQDYGVEYVNYIKGIQAPVSGKDSASIIYLPLFSKEKIVGILTVQSFEKFAYTDYDMDILRGLAANIGSAIENAMLYENLEEKVKERTAEVVKQKEQIEKASENTRLISEIGKEIAAELNSQDIITKVYERINSIMDASVFGIATYKPENNHLVFSGAMEKGVQLDDFSYSVDDERIANLCYKKSQEIIINDWSNDYKKYVSGDYQVSAGEKPESMIYMPLLSKDKKIGVITVQSFEKDVYSDYHLDILRTLSLYIASALENASLYMDMENRVKERTAEIEKAYQDTKLLSQISKAIVESLEVETIISSVYEHVNSLLDATCFGIGIYDDKSRKIAFPGFIENGKRMDDVVYSVDEDFLASNCFNKKEEIFIKDYNKEFNQFLDDDAEIVSGDETNSIIYLPLQANDREIGVMTVQSYKSNAYTEYHMDLLRSLATTVATALDNAMLYENLEEKVRERTLELSHQKEIIEEKNKHITDSIRYAKRIQDATLPSVSLVRSYLPESFVLFKPKDIVSGDFYWVEHVNDTVLFAVVDCTGHGVPGAFLSLIGHNSLNQIVNELGIYKPAEILYELDKIVYNTLQNDLEKTNIKDGMDMAICSLNLKTRELEFAGAYNPLYLIRDNELQEIKGDKLAIGSGQEDERYDNCEMVLEEGDRIYLFSDGYADQFGGPKGKKFKYSQFKELLVQINQKPMEEQHKLLNHYIEAWQGDLEQLDDVCVIGVRV
ncbi:GAF domain-containing protein [Paracrocinitomix mangrovi]|uniref:GAF domain-containing protein n=1 Tax=Paracrocinitomix mangrovi TaxID=2862509 RepID=UPI001C8E3960|nr:GAF domain-containing protein [Paracrocinitomix mangrovi]UKN02380.1 GAF domain-containing protein [Paracrocinitomix mangrovi]